MSTTTTELTNELHGGIGSFYDRTRQRVVIAEWGGRITSITAAGDYKVLGTGYGNLEDIAVIERTNEAIVTQRDGAVFRVDLNNADRAAATVIATLVAPHQVVLDRERFAFIVEFASNGRLVRVELRTGAVSTVVDGLRNAVGLAVTRDGSSAFVTENKSGRLVEIVLATGARTTIASGLVEPFMLSWDGTDNTTLLVTERGSASRVTEVNLRRRLPTLTGDFRGRLNVIEGLTSTGLQLERSATERLRLRRDRDFEIGRVLRPPTRRATTTVLLDPAPRAPSSALRTDFGIVVISDAVATLVTEVPAARVEFDVGGPIFPGAYQRVRVKIQGSTFGFDDLDFGIVEGEAMGQVSFSRDDRFDPLDPTIMLLVGPRLGSWTLEARHRASGDIVGTADLETVDVWPGADGPPIWFEGTSAPAVLGATWGGGGPEPQNLDINPQSGPWKVAVLLVDTADARYPADASAIATKWANETANGVSTGAGPDRSVKQFFREVAGMVDDGSGTMVPRLDIQLDGVHGPVNLGGNWEDYFQPISSTDDRWQFKTELFQAAATAGDDLIDFSDVDSFVVVVNTVPPADGEDQKMAWPFASGRVLSTEEGDQDLGVIVMPHDWDIQDSREIHETLSHEMGHNLGLPDIYMGDSFGALEDRDVNGWDTMSSEGAHSHFTTPFKLRLGWIAADDVKTFDFSNSGAVSEEVVLHASSLGEPPAGRFSAVEVRIANGWNYYFEYRSEQAGDSADASLPTDRRVVGTDVILPSYTVPIVRRQVILLPDDIDGDGPVLGLGDDFEETDASSPTAPADFKVEVLEMEDDWARIEVSYGTNSRPDPSIRPWPREGTNAWQSPDIEVFNDKNAADASFKNLPWTGHPNKIVARVKNSGDLLATDVRVNFGVKDFTVGDPVETPLGFDVKDIPAGDTVEFEFEGWVPPPGDHFCVTARIPLHVNSDALRTVEVTELNNIAQSNYTEFISSEASPPSRERTLITVANPYPVDTTVYLKPVQTNPFYRTYLASSMMRLGPGEERAVEMMFEALHNTPDMGRLLQKEENEAWIPRPNHVSISGFINDPFDDEMHYPIPTGGATVRVRTGMGTDVKGFVDGDVVSGRVTANDGSIVDSGQVIVTVREPGGDPADERSFVATVAQGSFFVEADFGLQGEGFVGSAEYLGSDRWAPSPPFTFTT